MVDQAGGEIALLQLGQEVVFQAQHNGHEKSQQDDGIGSHLNQFLADLGHLGQIILDVL